MASIVSPPVRIHVCDFLRIDDPKEFERHFSALPDYFGIYTGYSRYPRYATLYNVTLYPWRDAEDGVETMGGYISCPEYTEEMLAERIANVPASGAVIYGIAGEILRWWRGGLILDGIETVGLDVRLKFKTTRRHKEDGKWIVEVVEGDDVGKYL